MQWPILVGIPEVTRAIHKLDVDALRSRHPSVGDIIAKALALRVRRLSERLLETHYVPADRRILRRLAEFGEAGGLVPSPRRSSRTSPAPPARRSTASPATPKRAASSPSAAAASR